MSRYVALGWALPLLLIVTILLAVPVDAGQWLGISFRGWCLFLCAPATSLLLLACPKEDGPW